MELLAPSPLVAAQELSISIAPVGLIPAVSPCARYHTLIQLPSLLCHTPSPLGHSQSFLTSHPLLVGCYPGSGRSGLRNWRTIGQTAGLCKPGCPRRLYQVRHHFDSVVHVDVCCLREHNNVPVTMPGRAWHRCTRMGGHMAIFVEAVFLRLTTAP